MLSCLSLQPPTTSKDALRLLNTSKTLTQTNQIHAQLIRRGHTADPAVVSSLIRLYSSHGRLALASRAFSLLPGPTTFAWNLLIRAHTTNSSPLAAVLLYCRMLCIVGVRPDKFTLTFVAGALSMLPECNNESRAIHGYAIKCGLHNDLHFQNTLMHLYFVCGSVNCGRKLFDKMRVRSVVSWTALLSGLLACGEMEEATRVFKRMPVRNVVSWTAMIDGCARNGRPEEAFEVFWRMLEENVRPNEFTMVALLIACTELGSLSLGRWVHDFARVNGGLDGGVYVGTALIDMYSNCGSLEDAIKFFDQMPIRSLATWNSMITSLGVHGHGREAIALFREMEQQNVKPDEITLIGVLCASVRDQMFEEGLRIFRYITKKYALEPDIEHYRCLVELFDCNEVESIKHLILELDAMEQEMLLMACREHSNVELEEVIGSCINESDNISSSVERKVECFQWEVG